MAEPTPLHRHRRYTKRQKATAVIAAEMSSTLAAAQAAGIPESTLRYWMDDPEIAKLREKTREDLAEESSVLAHVALGKIKDRIDDFEPRDLVILLGVLVDKAQLLSGGATARTETRELLADFDDHEREAMSGWLREIAAERLDLAVVDTDAGS